MHQLVEAAAAEECLVAEEGVVAESPVAPEVEGYPALDAVDPPEEAAADLAAFHAEVENQAVEEKYPVLNAADPPEEVAVDPAVFHVEAAKAELAGAVVENLSDAESPRDLAAPEEDLLLLLPPTTMRLRVMTTKALRLQALFLSPVLEEEALQLSWDKQLLPFHP